MKSRATQHELYNKTTELWCCRNNKATKTTHPSLCLTCGQVPLLLWPHAAALLYRVSLLPQSHHQPLAAPSCRFPSRWLLLGDHQADFSFVCMQTQTVRPELLFLLFFKLCTFMLYLESCCVFERITLLESEWGANSFITQTPWAEAWGPTLLYVDKYTYELFVQTCCVKQLHWSVPVVADFLGHLH